MSLSFRTIRVLGLFFLVLVVVLSSLIAYGVLQKGVKSLSYIVEVEETRLRNWHDLAKMISDSKEALHSYISKDRQVIAPVVLSINKALKKTKKIRALTTDEEELAAVDEVKKELKTFRQAVFSYHSEIRDGYSGGTSEREMQGIATKEANEAVQMAWSIEEFISKKIYKSNKAVLKATKISLRFLTLGIIFVVISTIVFSFLISRALAGQIDRLVKATKLIAKGDLTKEIESESSDEIGDLTNAFNRMVRDLRSSRSLLVDKDYVNSIIANMVESLIVVDPKGRIRTVNQATLDLLGYKEEELVGQTVSMIFPEKERVLGEDIIAGAVKLCKVRNVEMYYKTKLGSSIPISFSCSTMKNKDGNLIGIIGIARDMREINKLISELSKLSEAIKQSINIVFIIDLKGDIEYVNPKFEQVTGYSSKEVIGKNPRILSSGEETGSEADDLWKTARGGKTWRGVFKNKKKNGKYFWVNCLISPITDNKGEITHFLTVQEDISDRMISEEKIKYLTSCDEMTGLSNRISFLDMLNKSISTEKDYGKTSMLLLVNIDGFRNINDTYGYKIGDECIRHVAGLMQKALQHMDAKHIKNVNEESILGRMGGDEFAIFLPSRNEKEGMETAEQIRKEIEKSAFPGVPMRITVTMGGVLCPKYGATTKELLTKADTSLYKAKKLGRNRCYFYHPEDREIEKMHSRLKWKEFVQKALDDDRIEVWFQPILDLKVNNIYYYEALVRIRDGDGAIVFPKEFIEIAEGFGLITSIDEVVAGKTMNIQAEMSSKKKHLTFSINLSGKDLGDEKFLAFLQSKISETGVDPSHLVFEITETAAVKNIEKAAGFIRSLRSMGCSFSLDDFGAGFTSFIYLREMGIDYVKIEGSFIKKLYKNAGNQLFVRAIVDIARGMGVKTVAEFVEEEATLKLLKEYGVDYAQGHLIGKASPNLITGQ